MLLLCGTLHIDYIPPQPVMQGVRGQKRTAPKTFDAGIALYAGMAAGGGQREGEGAIAVQVTYKLCTSKLCTFYMHFLLLFAALYGIMVVYVPCGENSSP